MKLHVIKDILGQPYLVVKYSIEYRNYTQIFNLIRKLKYFFNDDDKFLKIVNNDTITHGFDVKGYAGINKTIAKGDSVSISLNFLMDQTLTPLRLILSKAAR